MTTASAKKPALVRDPILLYTLPMPSERLFHTLLSRTVVGGLDTLAPPTSGPATNLAALPALETSPFP
jgi:hypothetical protein